MKKSSLVIFSILLLLGLLGCEAENMQKLHKYTIYSKVELLDFVAFVDDPSEFDLSITMFSMDR
ncbi:hypothetical protein LAV79_12945 [Peribacillus butanolivorans]|uniref:hypothetical protein n=1 Tax=Peribacillus butanolivorans TaxID=421767 RepID=UPI0030C9AAFC